MDNDKESPKNISVEEKELNEENAQNEETQAAEEIIDEVNETKESDKFSNNASSVVANDANESANEINADITKPEVESEPEMVGESKDEDGEQENHEPSNDVNAIYETRAQEGSASHENDDEMVQENSEERITPPKEDSEAPKEDSAEGEKLESEHTEIELEQCDSDIALQPGETDSESKLNKEVTFGSEGSASLPAQSEMDRSPTAQPTQFTSPEGTEANLTNIPEAPPLPQTEPTFTESESVGTNFEESDLGVMNLGWCFGFNHRISALNLSNEYQKVVMYVCAHVAVLYDFEHNRQKLLQAHTQNIATTSCSADKRWVVTACVGPDSMLVVWDTWQCIPVRTIFKPHKNGCLKVQITPDAKYIATISSKDKSEKEQVFALWNWLEEEDTPMVCVTLDPAWGRQSKIYFNPANIGQIITNSDSQVLFMDWKIDEKKVTIYAPPLVYDNFNKMVGKFSHSIVIQDTDVALTATSLGILVVWEENRVLNKRPASVMDKKALKLLELQPRVGFTVLTHCDRYIVTADVQGHVKFFTTDLQLVYWYSDLGLGPVNAVSFHHLPIFDCNAPPPAKSKYPESATVDRNLFVCRPFVVGTTSAVLAFVDPNGPKLNLIHREHDATIKSIVTHPIKPMLAIGSYSGLVKIWNYERRLTVNSRYFPKGTLINCMTFDPAGGILALGFNDGKLKLLDYPSLEGGDESTTFEYTSFAISIIGFSHDSVFMASADDGHVTSLYAYMSGSWAYVGRHQAHYAQIRDMVFGVEVDTDRPRLMTIAADRMLVEYDLMSTGKDDLRLLSSDRVEQSALPRCMAWYPPITKARKKILFKSQETFLVTANDQYKFKLYNATTKMCRRTLLGPTYGSPLNKCAVVLRDLLAFSYGQAIPGAPSPMMPTTFSPTPSRLRIFGYHPYPPPSSLFPISPLS